MWYTTNDKAKPRTEASYSSSFPYGSDGYRTNRNNTVGSSREIWCSNRETGRFHEKLGDSRENRESWQVCYIVQVDDRYLRFLIATKCFFYVTNLARAFPKKRACNMSSGLTVAVYDDYANDKHGKPQDN